MGAIFLRVISFAILPAILLLAGFNDFYNQVGRVAADEKFQTIHIFPVEVLSDDWEGTEMSKIRDLSGDAVLDHFDPSNSAYIATELYLENYNLVSSNSAVTDQAIKPSVSVPIPSVVKTPEADSETIPELTPEISPDLNPEISPEETSEANDLNPEESIAPEIDNSPVPQESLESSLPEDPEAGASSPEAPPPEVPPPESSPDNPPDTSQESAFFKDIESQLFAFYDSLRHVVINNVSAASSASFQEEIPLSCDTEGIKCLSRDIEFGGFGVSDAFSDKPIRNIQLRFSMAGSEEEQGKDIYAYSRLVIEYFFDGSWSRAGEVSLNDQVSNASNGGYFLHALPFVTSWEDLDDFRVRLRLESSKGTKINIFVDGLWLEVETSLDEEEPQEVLIEKKDQESLDLKSGNLDFSSKETPLFEYSFERKRGFFEYMASAVTQLFGAGNGFSISAVDARIGTRPEIDLDDQGRFSVRMRNPGFIRPGKHNIKIKINDEGREYDHEQEFLWGALLVNFDKNVYVPGEKVRMMMAVLDDTGQPACDASFNIIIKSSLSRLENLSTKDGTVKRNSSCGRADEGVSADFYADYVIPPETGIYEIEVTARTKNGLRTAREEVEVVKSPELVIERKLPTVTNPGRYEKATLKVTSATDWSGVIEERLPLNFDVFADYDEDHNYTIRNEDGGKILSWQASLEAGKTKELEYVFSVPYFSPAFYPIGPAMVGEGNSSNLWQLYAGGDLKPSVFASNPPHRCSIEPFRIEVNPGDKVQYKISLQPSDSGNYFVLLPGDLPFEANLAIDEFTGKAPAEIGAYLDVRPDAKKGSFNYSIIYQEPQENGRVLSTSCQFNLVIR